MYFIAVLLVTLATADECGDLCISVSPSPCSDKGSYCKNKHACMDLFWLDRAAGTMCNSRSGGGCSLKDPVMCKEAKSATAKKSVTTSLPETKSVTFPPSIKSVTTRRAHLPRNRESVNRGMINVGASCYFNAAVQALIHVPELRRSVLRREGLAPAQSRLLELFVEMGLTDDTCAVDPRPAMAAFQSTFGEGFDPKEAADAARAMRSLVTVLQPLTWALDMEVQEPRPCKSCRAFNDNQITSQVQEVYFPEVIQASTEPLPLDVLLHAHFGGRDLSDLACRTCGVRSDVQTRITVSVSPDVLILVLVRFNADGSKLTTPVDIPMELDLSEFATLDGRARHSPHYRLMSIVHHDKDHYVADYFHVEQGQWFRADDARVTPHKPTRVGATPYIVVYAKVQ